MAQRRFGSNLVLIMLSAALLCAHSILNALFPDAAIQISYTFFFGVNVLALVACLWRSFSGSRNVRVKWALVTAGLLLWFIADCMDAATVLLQHMEPVNATLKDFLYFFYGIPLLIIITLPEEEEKTIPLFVLLDALQVLAIGYLTYAVLFSVLPFSAKPEHPISEDMMTLVYDAENAVLALLATARLAFGARGAQDRRFFQVFVAFLWFYGICIFIYNHLLGNKSTIGWLDALVTAPLLVITLGALQVNSLPIFGADAPPPRHLALTLDNIRLILLSLTLVTLCAIVAARHLQVAIGFTAGAFVVYGIRSIILQTRFQQTQIALEHARDRLAEIALQDGLTGIANRRCFDERLATEWSRARRHARPLSLLLIDVDHFKRVNDTHGHLAGDECLKGIARALRSTLHRAGDLAARYGGEEFAILLPETDAQGAFAIAENIRTQLAQTAPCDSICPVTVSVGLTTWEGHGETAPEDILQAADRALYQAKQNGRNRVESFELDPLAAR